MPEGPWLGHGHNIRAFLENESSGVLATLSAVCVQRASLAVSAM